QTRENADYAPLSDNVKQQAREAAHLVQQPNVGPELMFDPAQVKAEAVTVTETQTAGRSHRRNYNANNHYNGNYRYGYQYFSPTAIPREWDNRYDPYTDGFSGVNHNHYRSSTALRGLPVYN